MQKPRIHRENSLCSSLPPRAALLASPSHVLSLVTPANVNHIRFHALVCTRPCSRPFWLRGRGHTQIPTPFLLQQTPLQNPALLSFGKQPALKYCLYSPEDSELPARLARADSLRRVPQLQLLILAWWDGHSSHPVPSTAGTHEEGSSPPAPSSRRELAAC